MDINSNESSKEENSAESESSKDESEIVTSISEIVSNRAAQCKNCVLASQIKKALPDVTKIEKRTSLHAVLQQLSEETLAQSSDDLHTKEMDVFHIPKKSLDTSELILEEYSMPGKKNKLLTDSFVRNLPVPFQEKRLYRQSIAFAFKRKPWYTKFHDFVAKKYSNFQSRIELWHDTLKLIEGQHGATMVSYFLFIRWLLYMNTVIFLLNFFFIVLPQLLFHKVPSMDAHHSIPYPTENNLNSSRKATILHGLNTAHYFKTSEEKEKYVIILSLLYGHLNIISGEDLINASSIDVIVSHCQTLYAAKVANDSRSTGSLTAIQNFLQGTGPLEPTHLFMGFYPPYVVTVQGQMYSMSLAFLFVLLATFIVCFIMMIQYTSVGIQEAFLARNKLSYYYSNEVFSAWDYCIAKPISATQQHYRFVFQMKTNLSEDRTAKEVMARSPKTWAKLYVIRLFINLFIVLWLFACYYLIYEVAMYQMRELQKHQLIQSGLRTFFIQFLAPVTITILNIVSPIIFSLLVTFENYHAQTELNLSLFRNVFVYLSSIIVLLNTFYQQIACKPKDICGAGLSIDCRSPICWETYVGQQLFRLTLTDLFAYVGVFLGHDVVRNYVTRNYDNKFTRVIGHLEFFLPTEVLAPVNSQTILWLGVFYSPLLPVLMILKLIIIFYIKKTKLLKFCDPSEHSFRASRFNAVFIMILMISFFSVLIVQSFAIERIPPSRGCGPFRIHDFITGAIPEGIRRWLAVLMSFWTIIFISILLCSVAVAYYRRVIVSQRELAKRLKAHLVLQSHDKQFLLKKLANLANGNSSKKNL